MFSPIVLSRLFYPNSDARSATFWQGLGLRPVGQDENVAVLELRGGTHLVVLPGEPECGTDAPFDLLVDDLDAIHADWTARGLDPSPIESGRIARSTAVVDTIGDASVSP